MQHPTRVETRVTNNIGILDIHGEVTSFSEKELQDAYESFAKEKREKIGLNFKDVTYINSAGMAIIISILTQSRKKGQALRAWGLTDHFKKIFDMVGITKYMDHFDSEEEALQNF